MKDTQNKTIWQIARVKGSSFFALLFAACFLLFLQGCQSPFEPQERTGTLSLTIGGPQERTIMPEAWQGYFVAFRVSFASGNPGSGNPDPVIWNGPSHSVELPSGTWDLTVHAFLEGCDHNDPASASAVGTVANVSVPPGGTANASVSLRPVTGGRGTFNWDISFDVDVATAAMEIIGLADVDESDGISYSLDFACADGETRWEGGKSLDAGRYLVVLTLSGDSGTLRISEILHVYRNMSSRFGPVEFTGLDFPVSLIRIMSDAWDGSSFYGVDISHGHFDVLDVRGVTSNNFDSIVDRFVYHYPPSGADGFPDTAAGLKALVDAALVYLGSRSEKFRYIGQYGSRGEAEAAIGGLVANGSLPVAPFTWADDTGDINSVTVRVGVYEVGITFLAHGDGGGCSDDDDGNGDDNNDGGGKQPPVDPDLLGPVVFIGAEGWRETFYVTWYALKGAASYNVYFRGGAAGDWTRIDDPLIREYEGGFFRADVLGIRAGTYDVRVIPVNPAGEASPKAATKYGIEVTAHVRTGFAFANAADGIWPGAYGMDGTPRPNARILYITNDNINTVQLDIVNDAGRAPVTFTGLASIIEGHSNRAHDTRPLIVRFIGKIDVAEFGGLNSNNQLQINRPTARNNAPITLEGVGNDATAFGWGIRTNRARFVEIRNLGFKLRNHNADSIDIDGNNTGPGYVWVHHNDFFYGRAGSGDFEKGDGDLDIRRVSHVTVSFNHFWDTGKTSLLGTQITEAVGFITYHNNHFNHSDGRHPRVRVHQVHMFNNYFNHVAQYAIGAAGGAPSIFAEANYFRRTRNPLLISRQGTDIAGSSGMFSNEEGGMIKAYGNFMCDWTLQHFRPWSPTNTREFDAFVVQNRYEEVPGTVVSGHGGHAFSNFDQNLGYTYTALSPQDARLHVLRYAGRFWGGEIGTDIPFAFGPADVGTARERRNPELDAILSGYRSRVVAVQGMASLP